MKLYLAGPDVFRADVQAWADEARALCRAHGHEALVPLDGDATSASEIYVQNLDLIAQADAVLANLNPFRGVEQRLLPASVVKQVCDDKAEEIEAQQGFKPGRKQMKDVKEAVMMELLPRAFTRRRKVFAWIDPKDGWLAIDAASRSAAEPVVEALHKALDELPLKLLNTENSPGAAMTGWLAGGDAPDGFSIDQDGELRAVTDEASAVRYVRHSLEGEEIREHIAAGKQVSKLALSFDDKLAFILTDKFEIKRLQPLDSLTGKEEGDAKSREEQFDADFALMTGQLRQLIPALLAALGGEVRTV